MISFVFLGEFEYVVLQGCTDLKRRKSH